jgi:hypothetical protein
MFSREERAILAKTKRLLASSKRLLREIAEQDTSATRNITRQLIGGKNENDRSQSTLTVRPGR